MEILIGEWIKTLQHSRYGGLIRALGMRWAEPAPSPVHSDTAVVQHAAPQAASFTEHLFQYGEAAYAYRLYLPEQGATHALGPLPLVVLLHGCQQDAADFAQGTGMNGVAERMKCIVLYPEQRAKANAMRCWNWYESAHQSRNTGEPGMIAALTRHAIAHRNADPARVYIAGLSAGGAMAAVVAGQYPDLFAALGVHSGLPAGIVRDMAQAMIAMRNGQRRTPAAQPSGDVMPTMVIHGSADKIVHPANGDQIAAEALAAMDAVGLLLEKTERTDSSVADAVDGRSTVRTLHSDAMGKTYVEHWSVQSAPHAWSGGDLAGSFTDPQGPSASQALLDFFLQHRRSIK